MDDVEKKKRIKKAIKSNERWIMVWIMLFSGLAGWLVWMILSQNHSYVSKEPEVMTVKSLTCTSDSYLYPLFLYDESDKKDFKIIVSFAGDEIRTISLQEKLYYGDKSKIIASESVNHAEMNNSFGRDGLQADALGASYSEMDDGLRFGLYENYNKLDEKSIKYFLLDEKKQFDYNGIKKAYEELGLECSAE